MYKTLIAPSELANLIQIQSPLLVLDCRFNLMDPNEGSKAYLQNHIPGAHYLNLDQDLSGELVEGKTGRHPLPTEDSFAGLLNSLGLEKNTQVVCYDDAGGMYAARAWWLFRWAGHQQVAILDGGWQRWLNTDQATSSNFPQKSKSLTGYQVSFNNQLKIEGDEVIKNLDSLTLLDARGEDRFRGENESIDPIAGHIPGAHCLPFTGNLDEDKCFLPQEQLVERFKNYTNGKDTICYCGSGVTACHNILAMAIAGLPEPRLYAGSWSHWITSAHRPIERG